MSNNASTVTYREPMVNYYVQDVERLAAFYCEHFGFTETFRTPQNGPAIHIEVRLGSFILGLASIDAARAMHQLPLNPGLPRGEVALWTDDVDVAFAELTAKGVRIISPPTTFSKRHHCGRRGWKTPKAILFKLWHNEKGDSRMSTQKQGVTRSFMIAGPSNHTLGHLPGKRITHYYGKNSNRSPSF